jgi:precorrin-6B methylase 2
LSFTVNDKIGLPPIILEVGATSESVAVELETVMATRSAVVSQDQVKELPVATRTNIAAACLNQADGA